MKYLLHIVLLLSALCAQAEEIHYQLTIDYKWVNYSGLDAQAMAINGSIPGPVLEFSEGDVAVISVTNKTSDEASIHWHGLLLPQDQDGVPYITYFPIKAGETFEYRFPLKHAGTYWYHSHTRIDEQKGQYGAIIVHPENGYSEVVDYDVVVQLSDWTDEDPYVVLKNLKKDGDWYARKKDSVVSLQGYIQNSDLGAWVNNRWQRMEGMDVSDVGYDAFLANGKAFLQLLPDAEAGQRIRVRLINSAASSYFDIQQNASAFTVVAADGVDVISSQFDEIRMGMAETYDFIVTIPESGAYEFAANSIDGTGGVKVRFGKGKAIAAPGPERPNLYARMQHNSDMTMTHHNHAMHKEVMSGRTRKLNYQSLRSRVPVSHTGDLQEFTLELTGDMESYNWSFDNTPLSSADVIKVDRGKIVRFHFRNQSMMHHPLHLHGHFFKVISGNGERDVIKHTVDVPPMGNVTIEFAANEEKDWFFHCHNLYHAKTGMARVVRYSDYEGNPEFEAAKRSSNEIMDNDWYGRGDISVYSSHLEGQYRYSNTRHILEAEASGHYGEYNKYFVHYNYKQSRWLRYFFGGERKDGGNEGLVGIKYMAPFLVETSFWVNSSGELNFEGETHFQLTQSFGLELSASTESEWDVTLEYRTSPYWSVALNVNDISGTGIGIKATF